MKLILTAVLLTITCMFIPSVSAQSGCDLIEWQKDFPAGAYRAPQFTDAMHDTTIIVRGQPRRVSIRNGFSIGVFADVNSARGLAFSPDGVLFVTSYDGAKIIALPDHNRDGNADSAITVTSGQGSALHGIGFLNGALHFSTDNRFAKVTLSKDRLATNIQTLQTFPGSGGHVTRTFVHNKVENKVYLQIGSTCNFCNESDSLRATVVEMNADGSNMRIFARGLRNSAGMDIDPRTGAVWTVDNGMDNLFGSNDPRHNDTPHEGIYILCDGANYGWPYSYGLRMRNPSASFVNRDTAIVQSYRGAVGGLLAHSAPLGLKFYTGNFLPKHYDSSAVIAMHGSWNRNPPAPPRILFMWADIDGSNARVADLVNGFQPDSGGSRWGRPVAVAQGPDKAFYVTDDHAGVVYRIRYTGVSNDEKPIIAINPGPFQDKVFNPGDKVDVMWLATRSDSVHIYSRPSPNSPWEFRASSRCCLHQLTIPNYNTATAQVRLISSDGAVVAMSPEFEVRPAQNGVPVAAAPQLSVTVVGQPTLDHVAVRVINGTTASLFVEVIDVLGVVRGVTDLGYVGDGTHDVRIDSRYLGTGSYILRLTDGSRFATTQFQITR